MKPGGIAPLDPCVYELKEIHRNVDVEIRQCLECGHVLITWNRTADTEDEIIEKLAPETDD